MNRRARRVLVAFTLFGVAGCHATPPPAQTPAAKPKPPRLVLSIVVDQFAAWEAAERLPMLPEGGGFARLRREGLYVEELRYAHAVTDTAPGHAALYTGAVPRATGIVANDAVGPDGKPRSILFDEGTRLVDARGVRLGRPGSSLARLRVETLADVLVAESPRASVYSFSLKDRGALFAAGRRPTCVLWLDVGAETFVTSTAFRAPPFLVSSLGDHDAVVAAYATSAWELRNAAAAFVETHAETPDDQPGEGDLDGLGRTFPHVARSAKALRATPFGDALVLELARGALEYVGGQARADATYPPALVALSLSSSDYVHHVFGPHSWEAWAELGALDRALATLFEEADRAVGPEGWAALVTSDHGGGALPEVSPEVARTTCAKGEPPARPSRGCGARRRLLPADVVRAFEAAATAALGAGPDGGPWLAGFAEPLVVLAPRGRALDGRARRKLRAAAEDALRPLGIARVVDTHDQPSSCSDDGDDTDALLCRAIDPSGPGDFYLLLAEGAFFDPDLTPGFGQSHGSPGLQDRSVPLFVRAPWRVSAGGKLERPVGFAAFTRTAASLLGVRPPAGLRGGEDLTISQGVVASGIRQE